MLLNTFWYSVRYTLLPAAALIGRAAPAMPTRRAPVGGWVGGWEVETYAVYLLI